MMREDRAAAAGERYSHGPDNFLVVARGFFPPATVRAVRGKIEARRPTVKADDERSRRAAELGVAPDALRLHEDWYAIWRDADLGLLREYGPGFTEVIYPPQIRTVRNTRSFVPWHQDAAYMQALGQRGHARVMTCFLPLDEDLAGRPTLQFCIDPRQGPVEHVTRPGETFNQFDLPERLQPRPETCRTFELALGDAYLFGQHVLHRTHAPVPDFNERTSMEFRLTTKAARIPGKDYFSLESLQFYKAG